MSITLHNGRRYRTTISLGFVERLASNDTIAEKFRAAGFSDIHVTGEGATRCAEGVWNGGEITATLPPQITDVSEVSA